ncbi:MAG: sulfite exporter TauE/SafE family protein [Chitinophagales bacterium]
MWQVITAGFIIGIVGSFHCIGMCGPIALALPVYNKPRYQRLFFIMLYNIGRMIAYASIGVLFGFFGKQFFIGGYQRYLSIILGMLVLMYLFFTSQLSSKIYFSRFTNFIQQTLGKLLRSDKKLYTYFFIGFLNGFLPCGLVYVAVAGATATGNVFNSALFMAVFGISTFPVMIAMSVLGKYISLKTRNYMRRLVPVFISVMAVLLILRGLNLGIPYVSPEIKATATGTHSCCHRD